MHLTKADETLHQIIGAALDIAMVEGIAQMSFGKVARRLGLSKSGVFARTGSLQRLQQAVLDEYDRRFVREVVEPVRAAQRGLPALVQHLRTLASRAARHPPGVGCLYLSGAFECASHGSALHERLQYGLARWRALLRAMVRDAIALGQLAPDTNREQLTFELHSLVVGMAHEARFLHDPATSGRMVQGCERLLATYAPSPMLR